MTEEIQKIIEAASYAPSGDNSQPWRFGVDGLTIYQINLPDKDNRILNYEQRGSHIAHGAALENMVITANQLGINLDISLFPDDNHPNLVAKIVLSSNSQDKSIDDNLYNAIKLRATNRRAYSNYLLSEAEKEKLVMMARSSDCELLLVDKKDIIKEMSSLVTTIDRIALENKDLHELFFNDIVWTEKEEYQKKSGLYIKTLELPPPIQKLFLLLRKWSVMQLLNKINFAAFAASSNTKTYSHSAAYGIIKSKNDNKESFIEVGRSLQRAWLQATGLGLSVQPVTGIVFLANMLSVGSGTNINDKHKKMALIAHKKIRDLYDMKDNSTIGMIIRIGKAKPPSATSSRLDVNDLILPIDSKLYNKV